MLLVIIGIAIGLLIGFILFVHTPLPERIWHLLYQSDETDED